MKGRYTPPTCMALSNLAPSRPKDEIRNKLDTKAAVRICDSVNFGTGLWHIGAGVYKT